MSIIIRLAIATLAATAAVPLAANAGTFTTLYTFTSKADGSYPLGPLLYQGGQLFGTTPGALGNNRGNGNVFKIDLKDGKFSTVYAFQNGLDGADPAGGVIYQNGLLYGTTIGGGGAGCTNQSCGTIFSIDPQTGTETILYTAPTETWWRLNQLVYAAGTLYGATPYGGPNGNGSAFAFDLSTNSFTTLYNFGGAYGVYPNSPVIYQNGLVYGTTVYGGSGVCNLGGCGTFFSIDPTTGTETVVRSFGAKDGKYPIAALAYYGGSFFGDTGVGGDQTCKRGCGVSYKIKATTGRESVLENFANRGESYSGITVVAGNAYETLPSGGNGYGELIQVDLKTGQQTVLYAFTGGTDGSDPQAALTYHDGAFYGTTDGGNGTVFKFVP
jgi:uncharacterized repeat protein (TIGR03803 family)